MKKIVNIFLIVSHYAVLHNSTYASIPTPKEVFTTKQNDQQINKEKIIKYIYLKKNKLLYILAGTFLVFCIATIIHLLNSDQSQPTQEPQKNQVLNQPIQPILENFSNHHIEEPIISLCPIQEEHSTPTTNEMVIPIYCIRQAQINYTLTQALEEQMLYSTQNGYNTPSLH